MSGISKRIARIAQTAEPSHARRVIARLVLCSASTICHSSGNRELKTNASSISRNPSRRIVFTPAAEKRRARSVLKIATTTDALKLNSSAAEESAAGGVRTAPRQFVKLSVTNAVTRISNDTPHPYATTAAILPRTARALRSWLRAAASALAGATNKIARHA